MSLIDSLQGRVLEGGWTVGEPTKRDPDATGGNFSFGYWAKHESGNEGFIKFLDFSRVMFDPDPARALQAITTAFNFERDILRKCSGKKLNRVVTAIADGKLTMPGALPIQYLIFEKAAGDVRSQVSRNVDNAFRLRCLHHTAVGLYQLHGQDIAHQDLKPSNVLVFKDSDSKICDLGSASQRSGTAPRDECFAAGALRYSPPELLYKHIPADWATRRLGCDLYMLGGLTLFLFTTANVNAMMFNGLDPQHRPACFQGTYSGSYDNILPVLISHQTQALEKLSKAIAIEFPEGHSQILQAARELCHLNPAERGHPSNRQTNQHSLERYVSLFELLARKAELAVRR